MQLDRRTLIAVVLCILLFLAYPLLLKWLGLDHHLGPPRRPPEVTDTARVATRAPAGSDTAIPGSPSRGRPVERETTLESVAPPRPMAPERLVEVETPLYRARFSSRGARLLDLELKHYSSGRGPVLEGRPIARPREGHEVPVDERVRLSGAPSFGLDLGSGPALHLLDQVAYDVAESLDAAGGIRALVFTARDTGVSIRQTFRVRPDEYALDLDVEIHEVPPAWRVADYSLTSRSWPFLHEQNPVEEERSLRATSLVGTNLHREPAGNLKRGKRFEGNALWAAVQTRYFMGGVAIVGGPAKAVVSSYDSRPVDPAEIARLGPEAKRVEDVAVNSLVVSLPGAGDPAHRFLVYFGPNEYFRLARIGLGLERLVDLGWSWIVPFSKLLLQILVWLHGLLHNYGLAIVVLATLVRVLLHPLNMMSIKSMRAMQRLQPEIERIKEKFKKDPQAMNAAVMGLYKEHKVNPAGGCLPLLLQMPLFIALYSVLFNAIELRQAPFVAWMTDLSAPDLLFRVGPFPVRLLPILMAVSGLLQQKMTPTDPRQAGMMYLMNVLMVVFFYNLPSGLVLYWTVMNLLTALQQWIALREADKTPAVVPAVPSPPGPAVARRNRPK